MSTMHFPKSFSQKSLLMPVLQVLKSLTKRLELRVAGMLAQSPGELDRDFLGFFLGVGIAQDRFEEFGVQDQGVQIVCPDLTQPDLAVCHVCKPTSARSITSRARSSTCLRQSGSFGQKCVLSAATRSG